MNEQKNNIKKKPKKKVAPRKKRETPASYFISGANYRDEFSIPHVTENGTQGLLTYENIVTTAEPNNVRDKSEAFKKVLREPYFFKCSWSPVVVYSRWSALASGQILLRKNLKTTKEWKNFFERLYKYQKDEVYVCQFLDISPDITSTTIFVFNPFLLKTIDEDIAKIIELENLQFLTDISKVRNAYGDNLNQE